MELQLVNKEIQDKIIELGFNWFKFKPGWYFQKDGEEYYTNCERGITGEEDTHRKFEIPITQSLVVKWLRDIHRIVIESYPEDFFNNVDPIRYWTFIHVSGNRVRYGLFETFEQAEEAGIIEALKLIKIND